MTLAYTEAKDCLQQAARKAPQAGPHSRGFRISVLQWLTLTRLLLGEVPERSTFRAEPGADAALAPYVELTQAVRLGDPARFAAALATHGARLAADRTLNLAHRLRASVIRAGLRRISVAYARISLADVAAKLSLDSAADAESVCAKAIRDGAIDASVDHAAGTLVSREAADLYATSEPLTSFHQRICFCLDTHNEAVQAMRYPPESRRKGPAGESEEARRERQATEQEIAQHMDEDDDF